jgi:hypothetical protein
VAIIFGVALKAASKVTVVSLSPALIVAVPAVSLPTIICPVNLALPTAFIVNNVDEPLETLKIFSAEDVATFANMESDPLLATKNLF